MSKEAFEVYERELEEQHTRNEARRIRTRVNEARRSPHTAGIRWPFELLQNALDAGPRAGNTAVTIALRHQDHAVVFEHAGAPLRYGKLAALLSGGSSKQFESEETTGRFGTGFRVTHVLPERTTSKDCSSSARITSSSDSSSTERVTRTRSSRTFAPARMRLRGGRDPVAGQRAFRSV